MRQARRCSQPWADRGASFLAAALLTRSIVDEITRLPSLTIRFQGAVDEKPVRCTLPAMASGALLALSAAPGAAEVTTSPSAANRNELAPSAPGVHRPQVRRAQNRWSLPAATGTSTP